MPTTRTRSDRCPGALRPWQAADGMLVRLRLIGGRVASEQMRALVAVAEAYGDGRVHVTSRTNLQVRAFPGIDGSLTDEALMALEGTGLLPARTHELVRNVMVSPQTGLAGGRVDLRSSSAELDRLLCADASLATLPGRFLFVLDDGRGDLIDRECDLGLVALDESTVQLRVGVGWGDIVPVAHAPERLAALAHEFVVRRGSGPAAPWHVAELDEPLSDVAPADLRVPSAAGPLPYGDVPGGRHVEVTESGLDRAAIDEIATRAGHLIVTPWRGVLIPNPSKETP
ncbi:nitrite reductase [Nocardioides sp. Kera G14]|uniref:nitrite reductase n=1 Tax=Nocardioides sp. Kera G14 TaxID=2884264 RepID=UPI001D12DA4E|nr:nitrite reductase [Nocardioides sp. Kera G14]UDY25020.1 nitrite reductase [Nocardioides sp. Kera G14]